MLTPQDVTNRVFDKAVFGGYDIGAVDRFLEELSQDYSALYRDNATLKGKLKVLVDKVEEYRNTEDAMRLALLTAQKTARELTEDGADDILICHIRRKNRIDPKLILKIQQCIVVLFDPVDQSVLKSLCSSI